MQRFMAIGECMVELAPGEGADTYFQSYAGDTFNTAWYMARISSDDREVLYLTALGDDPWSDRFLSFMVSAGVTSRAHIIPGASIGLYMISLEAGERSFSYWREMSAATRLADRLEALPDLKKGDIAYVSGITMAILPPEGRSRLISACAKARTQGVTIAFDPNLRPRLWASTDEMCRVVTQAAGIADIVLPSFEDEAAYFGDRDPLATARRYHAGGSDIVVVKDGPGPVFFSTPSESPVTHSPTPVPAPVDTTAAGDSFNAGFLAALQDGAPAVDALRAGCALSAKVVMGRGALVPVDPSPH